MSTRQDSLMQEGLRALRSANPAAAESTFEELLAIGSPDASVWFALAIARSHLGKSDQAMQAIDEALNLEPQNLRALLFKATQLEQSGQPRQALAYFNGAIKIAAGYATLPPDIQQGLEQARGAGARAAKTFENYLLESLITSGFHPTKSLRCKESLDVMFGRKHVEMQKQRPTRHLFPGLPQREFYEREEFAWVHGLEARTDEIRAELEALNPSSDRFRPYVERNSLLPELNQGKNVDSMDWSACYLWRDGQVINEVASHCPVTMQAMSDVPLCIVPEQMPSVLFSQLLPGASIEPHHGAINSRLICHLPLIVPENCGALKVGAQQRTWEEGKVMIFDDSVRHEAWNTSDQLRVVLIFDIWRPELDEEERHWISALLQAVEAYTVI